MVFLPYHGMMILQTGTRKNPDAGIGKQDETASA